MYVSIMKRKERATLKDTLNVVGYMTLLPLMARNHSWVHILAYDNFFRKSVPVEENWKVIHNNIWLATSASQQIIVVIKLSTLLCSVKYYTH